MNFQTRKIQKNIQILGDVGDNRISVTNQMLLKDGKAWIPVMGEMHYSRVPCDRWEENLRKMKDGGIDIVASYVFWIHHEEQKGEFDFSGSRDIRRFIKLCHKTGLEFCLRIGPVPCLRITKNEAHQRCASFFLARSAEKDIKIEPDRKIGIGHTFLFAFFMYAIQFSRLSTLKSARAV